MLFAYIIFIFFHFSQRANTEFTLDRYTDKTSLVEAIRNIQHTGGDTNIADGLRLMRRMLFSGRNGDRSDVKNVAIVITDGNSNTEADQVRKISIQYINLDSFKLQ